MSVKFRRYFLKAGEARTLFREASERLRVDLESIVDVRAGVEVVEAEFAEVYLVNGKPVLIKSEGRVFPALTFEGFFRVATKVVVDMGAVPFVCKGANVMAPGIRRFEGEFRKGDVVFVVDERYGKPLAVGVILYGSDEVKNVKQGVVVESVHFVSDRLWNFIRQFE